VKLSLDTNAQVDWTVVLGESLAQMSAEEWDKLLRHRYIVFARRVGNRRMKENF
jgi:hypothetical protein